MGRISGDGRGGRGQESGGRSVLRAEGNSHREHNRRSEENFFPLARGCAEKLPAGYGSPTGGKEIGRQCSIQTIDQLLIVPCLRSLSHRNMLDKMTFALWVQSF